MARQLEHPDQTDFSLDSMLAALADPLRRSIVQQLFDDHSVMTCGAFELPVSKATSTYHFRVLREAGLIHQHYEGTAIQNQLRRADVEAQFPGLLEAVLHPRPGARTAAEAE